MTEKRPIDANELMARFFRKECLMRGTMLRQALLIKMLRKR